MRRFVATVFDEWVYSAPMYTSDMYEDLLGSVDRYALQAIADAVSGSSVTLTVAYESSTDGRSWTSHGNLISGQSIDVLVTNVAVGGSDADVVTNRRVRFRIALAGTTPQAQVRLTVCGRDTSKGPARAPRGAALPSPMDLGGSPMAADARIPPGAAAAPTTRIAGMPTSVAGTAASPARVPNTGAGGGGALPPARVQPRSKGKAG